MCSLISFACLVAASYKCKQRRGGRDCVIMAIGSSWCIIDTATPPVWAPTTDDLRSGTTTSASRHAVPAAHCLPSALRRSSYAGARPSSPDNARQRQWQDPAPAWRRMLALLVLVLSVCVIRVQVTN